jgi:quercetin dioxygenase-like cupin family protein
MIRLVTLSTGADGQSHVEEHQVDLAAYGRDLASQWLTAGRVRFQESPPGSTLDWHCAPRRQLVVILRGTIEFETRGGERVRLNVGDVLLAADTTGGGHRWHLVGDEPWQRLYVELAPDTDPTRPTR